MIGILPLVFLALVSFASANDTGESEDEKRWPRSSERFVLKVGAVFLDLDSEVTLNGTALPGDKVNLQRDLGLDESETEPFLELTLRLSRRQRLEFSYMKLDQLSVNTLTRTFNFGEESFTVGTDIISDLELTSFRIGYGYSFLSNERRELGFTVGVSIIDLEFGIKELGGAISARGDYTAPLPDVGLYFECALTPKVAVLARGQIFYANWDQYEAVLFSGSGAIEVYPTERLLFGVGYVLMDLDFEVHTSSFDGEVDLLHQGPIVYSGVRF